MATVFGSIIDGELPGRFVWADSQCVAFLSISPAATGHTLVVPRAEIDHWIDLPDELSRHLMAVAQQIGRAQMTRFDGDRIGLAIAGFDVPHTHLHVFPTSDSSDFAHLGGAPASEDDLEQAARSLCSALVELGHDAAVENALVLSAR